MQSGRSLMGYFALGIGALHSTTGLWTDYMAASRTAGALVMDAGTTAFGSKRSFRTIKLALAMQSQKVRILDGFDPGGEFVLDKRP